MTKILNLDKIETKREKVLILKGVEHAMVTFTVRDYIDQMKSIRELNDLELEDVDSPARALEITIDVLSKAFPTIKRKDFESLSMEQLSAIRELVEDTANSEAPQTETGEIQGETV